MTTKRLTLAAAATATLLPAQPLLAKIEPEPISDWALREYDDKCRIAREFGTDENAVTLWVDKGGPGPSVNLTFIGKPLRDPVGPLVRFAFVPDEPVERNYIKVTSSTGRPVVALFGVRPMDALPVGDKPMGASTAAPMTGEAVDLAEAKSTEEETTDAIVPESVAALEAIELAGAIRERVTLDLAGFESAMAQLLDCTERLTARLNAPGQGGSPAVPREQQGWVQNILMNYPAHLLRREEEGTVSVRLTINGKGRASFCEVIDYSGPASFNETACLQLLKHARFHPSTGEDGEPRADFWTTRVTYSIRE